MIRGSTLADSDQACRPGCPACDPRIARSKKALRDAMIGLMEEQGFESISVNDLCQRAGLNRGTFYNHFHTKEDMLAAMEGEVLSDLERFRPEMQRLGIPEVMGYRLAKRPMPLLVDFFECMRGQGDFFHAVLGPGGDPSFGPRLRDLVCTDLIKSVLHEKYRNDPSTFVGYYVAFYASAYLGVIVRWIETGMEESPEQMALIAMRLLFIKPGEHIEL